MRNVPELRFDGYDGEWEENKFSENFDTTIPKNSLSRDKLTNQVTRVKNIHYGDIHKIFDNVLQSSNERIPHIINDDLSAHERYFLQDGDIIFTDAAEDNTAGKCVELDIDDGSNIVAGLHTIPARPIKFGKYFYGFYLNSNSFHNKIIPLLEGTKVSSISKTNLNTLSVIVPNVEEQEKIGNLFKKIDALIEIQEGKVSKMEDFKKSMLQKMFPKKDELIPEFRFDGFDGELNSSRINELIEYSNGNTLEPLITENGDLEVLNLNSVSINGQLKGTSKYINSPYSTLEKNDIIMILSDIAHGNLIGKTAVIPESNKYVLNQRVAKLKPKNIDSYFLSYYINHNQKDLYALSAGTSQLNLSKTEILKYHVRIPALEEQQKIGQFFKNLDTQIENEERLLDSYKMMKKSLLQKMFV